MLELAGEQSLKEFMVEKKQEAEIAAKMISKAEVCSIQEAQPVAFYQALIKMEEDQSFQLRKIHLGKRTRRGRWEEEGHESWRLKEVNLDTTLQLTTNKK